MGNDYSHKQVIEISKSYGISTFIVSRLFNEIDARMKTFCPAHRMGFYTTAKLLIERAGYIKNVKYQSAICSHCKTPQRLLNSGLVATHYEKGSDRTCRKSNQNVLLEQVLQAEEENLLRKPVTNKHGIVTGGLNSSGDNRRKRPQRNTMNRSIYAVKGVYEVSGGLPTHGKNK